MTELAHNCELQQLAEMIIIGRLPVVAAFLLLEVTKSSSSPIDRDVHLFNKNNVKQDHPSSSQCLEDNESCRPTDTGKRTSKNTCKGKQCDGVQGKSVFGGKSCFSSLFFL